MEKKSHNIFAKINIKKLAVQLGLGVISIALISLIGVYNKSVTIAVDGKQTKISTFKTTVGDVLKKQDITLGIKDKISKELDAKILDDDVITIKRAVKAKIIVDGTELNVMSSEEDIKSMFKAETVALGTEDRVSPAVDTKLHDGIDITITRVKTKTITESFPLKYETTIKKSNTMLSTNTKVLQEGKRGEKQVTTDVVYENGKEIARKVISEAIIKQPIAKITLQGTLATISFSRGGDSSKTPIKLKTTAYWAVYGIGTTYTASGKKAVRDENGYSTVAVDTKIFPMGTKLYIDGYGYAIAADRGTSIIGNHVDVYFNTKAEALRWGLKYVNAYVVK
jgi:uncharacterized protein YabE (DUF348 family)